MTLATKPQTLRVQPECIPSSLKESPRWSGWRWIFNTDKVGGHHQGWDKPPLNPKNGGQGSTTDPTTWGTYEDVVNFMSRESFDGGIGFNLLGYENCVVHDLDNCLDPETGEISPQAMNIVRLVGGYWEITPSGTGIRGICWGKKTGKRVEASKGGPIDGAQYDGSKGRYVTLTGHLLPESTADIFDAHPGGIGAAYALMFPVQQKEMVIPEPTPSPVDLDDVTLLERAAKASNGEKFSRLWSGDFSDYSSQSEADLALCSLLVFYCGGEPTRVDRLFRQSALYLEKWDEPHGAGTYGQMTIAKSLEGQTHFYKPGQTHRNGSQPDMGAHPHPTNGLIQCLKRLSPALQAMWCERSSRIPKPAGRLF